MTETSKPAMTMRQIRERLGYAIPPDGAEAPAATCSAQHHGHGEPRACIRAAQHHRLAHTDEHGYHWSDTVAIYPLTDGGERTGPPAVSPSAPADRAARWEAAAHAAGREVDRNALAVYMAVGDAEQAELRREHAERLDHIEGALARIRDRAEVVQVRVRRVLAFAEQVVATSGPDQASAVQAVIDRLRAAVEERPASDLAAASDPTPLRWGLNDTLWGDDDTVTVLLSGPGGEPYWLELDPERAGVLREDLAGPDGAEPLTVADTLPAWLRQRFTSSGVSWENLDDAERSYWEHQARAVRRAVTRGGFKAAEQPAAVAQQPQEADGNRIVAYQSPGGTALFCTRHRDELSPYWPPVFSEDLPDGGICAHSTCGADLLIPQQPGKEA